MKSSYQITPLKTPLRPIFLLVVIANSFLGCGSNHPKSNETRPPISISVLATSDTKDIIEFTQESLKTTPLTTSLGTKVTFTTQYVDGAKGLKERAISRDTTPSLAVVSSDFFVSATSSEFSTTSGSLIECASLGTAQPLVAYRAADPFDFTQVEEPVEFSKIFERQESSPSRPVTHIIMGHPLYSGSGVSAFLGLTASIVGRPATTVSNQSLISNSQTIREKQERVMQYFYSDRRMLDWLSRQEGGRPLIAITDDRQFSSFMKSNPDSGLQKHPISVTGVANNYPVCLVSAPWVSTDQRSAALAMQSYLQQLSTKGELKRFGISSPVHQGDPDGEPTRMAPDAAATLINHWDDFGKPTAPSFVIDNSVSMDGLRLDAVTAALSTFITSLRFGTTRQPTTLVSFGSKVVIHQKFSTDQVLLQQTLSLMKPLGGSAIRDAILRTIELYEDTTAPGSRRPILAIIDGKDTASLVTPEQFQLTTPALLSRKGVVLYVIGIAPSDEDYGELPRLIDSVGGLFRTSITPNVANELSTILPDLR